MAGGSPSSYLLWSLLSAMFQVFLLIHLWNYDRFQCIRWNSGRQPGAFKRVMTYSYLANIPLLIFFSVTMCAMKYQEGYVVVRDRSNETRNTYAVYPKPIQQWSDEHKDLLLPVYFVLAVAWSFEIVTHLEELTFWLYLMHQGPQKRDWFHSYEFRAWYIGCMLSFLGLFVTVILTRRDLETCPAWIFTVGASISTAVTLLFLYVLARFPSFIQHIKDEGATPDVVVRLSTFYQLNLTRVVFRFLFTVPLLSLGLDGIQSPPHILRQSFLPDFLFMVGGIGCFVSSACTLLTFFPRSVTREQGFKVKVSTPNPSVKTEEVQAMFQDPNLAHPPPLAGPSKLNASDRTGPTMKFPPSTEALPSSSQQSPRNSNRFYMTDEGEIVEASPQYTTEDQYIEEEYYGDEDGNTSAMSHQTGGLPSSPAWTTAEHLPKPQTPARIVTPPPPLPSQSESYSLPLPLPIPLSLPPPSPELHLRRHPTSTPSLRKTRSTTPARRPQPSSRSSGNLHPYVQNFTSPIDLFDAMDQDFLPKTR